jgi:hypothetical protein
MYAGPTPTDEVVWARSKADYSTVWEARRSVLRGVAARDEAGARVAIAMVHDAWHRSMSQRGLAVRYVLAALCVWLSLRVPARLAALAFAAAAVALGCQTLWLSRLGSEGGRRAERANLALLEQAGASYSPGGDSRAIDVAPARLMISALAVFVFIDAVMGYLIGDSSGHRSLWVVAAAGAPIAAATTAGSVLKFVWIWRPRKR